MDYKTLATSFASPNGHETGNASEETITKAVCELTLRMIKQKFDRIEWFFASSKNLVGSSFFIIFNEKIHVLICYGNCDYADVFHNTIIITGIESEMTMTPVIINTIRNQIESFINENEWMYTDSKFTNTTEPIDIAMNRAFSHPTEAIIPDESEIYDNTEFDSLINEIMPALSYETTDDNPFSKGIAAVCCDTGNAERVIEAFTEEIEKRDSLIGRISASMTNMITKPEDDSEQKIKTAYNELVNKYNALCDEFESMKIEYTKVFDENEKLRASMQFLKKVSSTNVSPRTASFNSSSFNH